MLKCAKIALVKQKSSGLENTCKIIVSPPRSNRVSHLIYATLYCILQVQDGEPEPHGTAGPLTQNLISRPIFKMHLTKLYVFRRKFERFSKDPNFSVLFQNKMAGK